MRAKTIAGSTLAVLGVLLLAAAGVLYWAVAPNKAQLPSDTNTTRDYAGTAKLLVSPAAVLAGDKVHAVITNAPVTATDHVKVLATSGSAAQVSDTRTLMTNGQTANMTQSTYAVDRKSLAATTSHPSGWTVTPAEGLTVSFPIPSKQQTYTGWVSDTQSTTPLKYVKQETVNGRNTYVYQAILPPTAIKDKQVLSQLPAQLPGAALGQLGSALPIPDALKAQLAQLLPSLQGPVPLTYTYSLNAMYWVDPSTGTVVDVQQEEIRQAGLASLGAAAGIPIYDVQVRNTPASVQQATNDAQHNANQLSTVQTTLPLIFLIVGVLALIAGVLLILMGRRRPPSHVDTTPTPA
jgi:hypothetical protein